MVGALHLEQARYMLDNYARIKRHLFIDGAPTSVLLVPQDSCGIPQGCPVACIFANLGVLLWAHQCELAVPTAFLVSYLDDWLIVANSWQDLQVLWDATLQVCSFLGTQLNLDKTVRGVACQASTRVQEPIGTLRDQVRWVTNFKYQTLQLGLLLSAGSLITAARSEL